MRTFALISCLTLFALGAVSSNSFAEKKMTIGVAHYVMSPFMKFMLEGMDQKAETLGVTLVKLNGEWDSDLQYTQMETLVAKGVDAIVVTAIDNSGLDGPIAHAHQAGIPIIAANMYVYNRIISGYSGPDDVMAGEMMVDYVAKTVGRDARILHIAGSEGFSATTDRRQGVYNGLARYPQMEQLAIANGMWNRERAREIAENWIQTLKGQFDAIVVHNDNMAKGVSDALVAAKLKDKVVVCGIDATYEAVVDIRNGRQDFTVYQDGILEGGLAVEYAYNAARTGAKQPETFIKMIGVDKANAQKYIDMYEKMGFEN